MTNATDAPVKEQEAPKKPAHIMSGYMNEILTPQPTGELVEGVVIAIESAAVYVDLPPFGTGIIYGREYINAREIIKKIAIGDTVTATVVDTENENGYVEVSLKEARQALIWGEAEKAIANRSTFELTVKDANKGGLILEWQGIQGFIPASQLKSEHYPRVDGGDKDKILGELQKLVGETLSLTIIAVDPKEGKLIFSEKDPEKKEKQQIVGKYDVGDVVEGDITGIVDFGVFVQVDEGLEGLAHISELDWGLVEDPRNLFKVGEHVKARVIEIKEGQISLSIKALKEDPWTIVGDKYKKDDKVEGVIIKFNKHGALASIEEGVAGLVHNSEFETPEALREKLELGKPYPFVINLFEPKEHRMTLGFAGDK